MTKSLLRIFISHPWSITVVLLETGADSKKSKNMSIFKFKSRWPQEKVGKIIERFWNWCQPVSNTQLHHQLCNSLCSFLQCKQNCLYTSSVAYEMLSKLYHRWLIMLPVFSYQIFEKIYATKMAVFTEGSGRSVLRNGRDLALRR